jgi:hypothetical protein
LSFSVIWTTEPLTRELTLVTFGDAASTMAVTADVVVVLPASSVTLAVKLWLPSRSLGVTKVQLVKLSAVKFAVPSKVAPS